MRRFEARQAILEAAEEKLDTAQFRRLRTAMLIRPFAAKNAVDMVTGGCEAEGLIVIETGGIQFAIDWARVLELVFEYLPLILKLFGIGV